MPNKVWDEITCQFPNFNGCTVEVWEWIRNFTPHFVMYVIIYAYQGKCLLYPFAVPCICKWFALCVYLCIAHIVCWWHELVFEWQWSHLYWEQDEWWSKRNLHVAQSKQIVLEYKKDVFHGILWQKQTQSQIWPSELMANRWMRLRKQNF